MKKVTSLICLVFVAIMVLSLPVGAATPYYTYTYSISGTDLRSPDAYVPDREVDSAYMGLTDINRMRELYPDLSEEELALKVLPLKTPTDLATDENDNVYVVDRDNSRLIVLDPYYKVKFIIDTFKNNNGNVDQLNAPEGVFITESKLVNGREVGGRIFLCDTGNSRILTFDTNGNFQSEIGKPKSELIDATSVYSPAAVAVDRYDRLYVVDKNSQNGIVVMTDEGIFTNYIGAQKVEVSFWQKFWKRFMTEEQKEQQTSAVITPYNNITLAGDFIYATIELDDGKVQSAIQNKDKSGTNAPVKMLNAAGSELMRRNGFYPPSGEIDFFGAINAMTGTNKIITGPSQVVDVAVGPENTWSIIDRKRSKVFTYDFDGNLLFAFGDQGDLLGNISENALRAIDYQGDAMLLLDSSEKSSFTVYQRTEYGDVIMQALENQNNRRYDAAIDDWTEILKRNSNFDTAYIGIGNALARLHKYEEAVEQYKLAYDTANYSIAYSELRQEWISNYLWTLPIIIFVICFALAKFLGFAKKVNKKVAVSTEKRTYGQELLFAFHLILHPFDGFWDLKHEKRGSVRAGTTILAATIAVFYYDSIGSGYVTNPQAEYGTIFGAITGIVVPLALWIVANWCLTTLFDGEGSMKDVYIASTYSLLPLIITMIPATIASNFILANEVKTVSLITTIGLIWMGLLMFCGTMVTHDYTIGKNVITVLATLVGMICIMFIAILFSTLLGKLVSFVTNIVTELRYRM